jgi:hypothetical protein
LLPISFSFFNKGDSNDYLIFSGFFIKAMLKKPPKTPKAPIEEYAALHPIFLIKMIDIEEKATPKFFPIVRIALALLLFSCGK